MKKICLLFLFSIVFSPLFAQRQSFTWQDVQREYIINVPSSWDGQREIPVLFVLHGLNAEIEETSSQLNATMFSDLTGWITIFPQALDANINVMGQDISLGKMWNANLSVNIMGMTIAPNSEIDDQGFILSILDSVKEQYAIDEDSIFVAGGSMGGFMANYMGIKHSDIFKGMAAISGSVPNILVDSIPSN
ncbi:MAG: prolyl oligopeptidase family serine peptidase, partial [Bacteroidota bacterium]|nr:prolyl oligopeptidase family serine peptidase [Bacteroidota bacterium]